MLCTENKSNVHINYLRTNAFELTKTSTAIFSRMVAISFSVQSNVSRLAVRYSVNLKVWAPQLPLQFTTSNTL